MIGRERPRDRSEEELAGYRAALDWVFSRKSGIAITPKLIRRLHALAQGGAFPDAAGDAGEWKTRDNEIIEFLPSAERRLRFVPVSAAETPEAVDLLCRRYRAALADARVPPLLVVSTFVFDLFCIHPFRDGNGRVSRLVTSLPLDAQGFPVGRYISMERLVEQSKEDYYRVLKLCSEGWHEGTNAIVPWWNYFLGIVRNAYREFERQIESAEARPAKSDLVRQTVLAQLGPFTLADLAAQLPVVSSQLIKKVLAEMKGEGLVMLTSRGRGARWEIACAALDLRHPGALSANIDWLRQGVSLAPGTGRVPWDLGPSFQVQQILMSPEKGINSMEEAGALEELTSDGQGSGLEVEHSDGFDGDIRAPFDPSKIDVVTQARTVDLLLTRLREGELDLSPDFQRRANIWDERRKSSLIESMLLRIPIPSLYVSEDRDGNYTVVDGLQRLCAIAHFVDVAALNKAAGVKLAPLRLVDLQSLVDQKNKSFAELPRPLKRRISETELTLHVIRASTPSQVKFNIFSRINQGGLPLTAQEIRNAIYPGDWRQRVRQLAESEIFLKATEGKIKKERMEDTELVLRFVAHFTLAVKRPEDQNLDEFLNETVGKRSGSWSVEAWADIERAFGRALEAAVLVFGNFAFRKYFGPNESRRPINRGLFETETVVLARRSTDELKVLAARSAEVLERLARSMNNDEDFKSALLYATGRGSSSNKRIEVLDAALNEVLNA